MKTFKERWLDETEKSFRLMWNTLIVIWTVVVVLAITDSCHPEIVQITILPEEAEPVSVPLDQPIGGGTI